MNTLSKIKEYLVNEIRSCDTNQFYGEPEDVNEEFAKNEGRKDALQEILDLLIQKP